MPDEATRTRGIPELLDHAVRTHLTDDDPASIPIYQEFLDVAGSLRACGMEAVDACWNLFRSGDARERATAADLFGRMTFEASTEIRDGCRAHLVEAIDLERDAGDDPDVLSCLASSIGHAEDVRALPALLSLVSHPSEDVRFSLASAIPNSCRYRPLPEAVAALVKLSADSDSDVRDWSCFGLGQLNADLVEVREALAARLDDADTDTRCEALVALAQLGDARAYERVVSRFDSEDAFPIYTLEINAAAALGDERLHRTLLDIQQRWERDDDYEDFRRSLDFAIRRCDPTEHERAHEIENELVASLSADPACAGFDVGMTGSYPFTRLVIYSSPNAKPNVDDALWDNDQEPSSFSVTNARDWYLKVLAGETKE